jgi:hypothetical protein
MDALSPCRDAFHKMQAKIYSKGHKIIMSIYILTY